MNWKQIKYREEKNIQKVLQICPDAPEKSGIYAFLRYDYNSGFKFAYIGQAKNIISRLGAHLSGYQHIDLSIKAHGLFSEDNKSGWNIKFWECSECDLDENERKSILYYANKGFQLRNKTSGGQGVGKIGISPNKSKKGYYDGLKKGYENTRKNIIKLFDKNLVFSINGKPNKNKQKAFDKFKCFLEGKNDSEE